MDRNFCDKDGAHSLKRKIEEYWRDKGHEVEVKLVDGPFTASMRSSRTDLRSDMLNGLPRAMVQSN